MERLGHLIYSVFGRKEWTPFSFLRTSPKISHLFFADDLILFCKADKETEHVNGIINSFYGASRQKINRRKTQAFFSLNTPLDVTNGICSDLGVLQVDNLGMYLGVPFFDQRVF